MSRCARAFLFAGLSVVWCGVSASAETLRCRSVNGNLTCAGSSSVSCQTVNGTTVCVSGQGDVVQSFGKAQHPGMPHDIDDDAGDPDLNDRY